MTYPGSGFREIEHTADWELEVWAPDLSGLLEQAARGMYQLSGARLVPGPRLRRKIKLKASDSESLLVSFLTELIYIAEMENLAFDTFHLTLQDNLLNGELTGAQLASLEKEIKAVTYHGINILQTRDGLQVNVVFDV